MPKIAACLIVKNSEATIERALESVRPFVDEINVYDTGSTDGTVALLERMNEQEKAWYDPALNAIGYVKPKKKDRERMQELPLAPIRVQSGEWRDDFSWAREQSFAMASEDVDWLVWLDDDDVVVGAQHFRPTAYTAHPSTDGFVCFYDYAQDEFGTNICQLWRERLIRRTADGAWVNPIHEVWLPHGEGQPANYIGLPRELVQYKHLRPAGDRYSPTRNLEILQRLEADAVAQDKRPDLRTLAYLGTEMMSHGRHADAIPYLQEYLSHPESRPPSDERAQVFHKLAQCLQHLGNSEAAMNVEFDAVRERDDWTENLVGLAEAFFARGDHVRTIEWAKRAIEKGMPQSPLILNPLECELLPKLRLAESLGAVGQYDQAKLVVQEALSRRPGDQMLQGVSQQIDSNATIAKIVDSVMTLRETLIRHDENWKAWELFDAIPYIVEAHPTIVSAKAMTRENVMHALKPEEYLRWYEDEPKESTVEDEQVPMLGDQIERAGFTLELAVAFEKKHGRKPRILDLGANDAWMACYLWLKGEFVSDGIELNKATVAKGIDRLERFGAPGQLIQGDIHEAAGLLNLGPDSPRYDIVTCYEVYEHVPSTDALLEVMESLLSPEGVACITTPAGAYEQGNLHYWQMVERKGHLRAVTPNQLTGQLLERGTIDHLRIHQGERLVWAAWRPKKKKGRIHILGGGSWEPWSPHSISEGGLGGSETALVHLACGLSQDHDWDVRVFCDAKPGLYMQSLWSSAAAFDPSEECDAVIVSRNPAVFDVELHAPNRMLWCHDHTYEITDAQAERITHVVALSKWHEKRTKKIHGDKVKGKTVILRNGILLEGYDPPGSRFPKGGRGFEKRKPRMIYSSSADRGLDTLLEVWPEIRARVKDATGEKAELHVFYGWNVYDSVMLKFQAQAMMEYKTKILELAEAKGVKMRGRIGQKQMYEEMAKARVWSYPTQFLETSCISAMEARASGLSIITSGLGALKETVGEHGHLIDWSKKEDEPHNESAAYREEFVESCVLSLTDEFAWDVEHAAALDGVEKLDWRYRIAEWDKVIEKGRKT